MKLVFTLELNILLTFPRRSFFCGSFVLFMSCVVMLSRLFIAAAWSPAGKGLTSWLLFVMFNCVFATFLCGILGQVWYLMNRFLIFAVILTLIYFTGKICALVAAVVKTQIVFSSHCGFLACVKLKSLFNNIAEKMLIYKKDSLIYYN